MLRSSPRLCRAGGATLRALKEMAKEAGSASERLPLLSGQIQGQNTESLDTLLGTPAYADESSPDGGALPGSRRGAPPGL